MAKEKETVKSEGVKPVAEIQKTKKASQKFTLDKLRENSDNLFGISKSTFDGAVYGLKGEFTVSETKNIITNWKKKEAK